MSIKGNLNEVRKKVEDACLRVNRDPKEVTLIAVSKTKPLELIKEVIEEGIVDLGENKVQEMIDKIETLETQGNLNSNLKWHLIGHLQRNKVKYIIGRTCLVHSVDSIRLAEQISEEAKKKNVKVPILVEVNIGDEESKFGVSIDECENLIKTISNLPGIEVKGLMTIAPFVSNPEDNRIHFRNLRKLFVDIKYKNIDNVNMETLSMGMTNDFEVAIEEGATMVRVGTGIFGERQYM